MDSQKIQEIIISTIEEIAKNTVLNTNFLTLINGQISYVDKFNNYYNFTYQKEEYTGFSITGEKYEVGDLVYVLKLNNDLTSKQMIISKVNSYANFDIELAINNSLEEIKNSINQIETQDKEISIIGNTIFTLNDDLTITPEELTFSAQKSSNINDIVWYVDGEQQVQDELKRLTISSSMVKNKDSLIIRVEDFNNSEVYDEITVIRAMSSDTKLELDLGLDSILLQKNEQGIIDYSKAILTPKVLSEGEDITSEGWSFNYKIENGAITLVKEQNSYKITNMDSDKGKISFFAIKNGNMYLQKVIYLSIVTYGDYNLNITVSNQNFLISKTDDDKIKENTLSTTIRALKGDKILKIVPDSNIPQIGNAPGKMVVNDDYSVTYSWDLTKETIIDSVNGEIKLLYTIENEQHNSIILWTTVNDGTSGAVYRLDINPPNIIKNGDGAFSPNEIIIKSLFNKKGNEILYDGYFKIYKTIDNKIYTLDYESKTKENTKNYTITDLDLKSLKIEFLDINKKLLITEYCYVNVNSSDFIEVTTKTENNETHLTAIDGQIQGLVKKDETIETTITNLQTNTEQKFTETNEQYSEINQQIDNVTITVSDHTEQLESINGEIVSQGERLSKAEQKITNDAIISTVTNSSTYQNDLGEKVSTADMNSAIEQTAGAIRLEVSSVQDQLDNLETGARNLIIRSTETTGHCLNEDGSESEVEYYSISDYITITPDSNYMFTKTSSELVDTDVGGYFKYAWYGDKQIIENTEDTDDTENTESTEDTESTETTDEEVETVEDESETTTTVVYPFLGFAQHSENEYKWTSPTDAHYIRICYPNDSLVQFEKGNIASDWTPAPEDTEHNYNDKMSELTKELNSVIQQTESSIVSSVSEKYYTKEEAAQLESSYETKFTETSTAFEMSFNTLQTNISSVDEKVDNNYTEMQSYIRFVDGTIIIGRNDSDLILTLTNDRMSFQQGSKVIKETTTEDGTITEEVTEYTEVAYISDNNLYIYDGSFINSLKIGRFSFVPRENGNLSFTYVGAQ